MTLLGKSRSSLNIVNISRAMSATLFLLNILKFEAIFCDARFMLKICLKIAGHEQNEMPTSLVTALIVIRRLSKMIFFISLQLFSQD